MNFRPRRGVAARGSAAGMSHPRPCWQSFFWRDVRRTAARRRTRYAPRRRPRRRISSCFAPVPRPLRLGSQATAFCRSARRRSTHRPIRSNSMQRGRGRHASSTPREMSSRSTESSQESRQARGFNSSSRCERLNLLIPLAVGSEWCPEEDSNLHSLRNTDLNRARLPIPPSGLVGAHVSGPARPVNALFPCIRSHRAERTPGVAEERDPAGGPILLRQARMSFDFTVESALSV